MCAWFVVLVVVHPSTDVRWSSWWAAIEQTASTASGSLGGFGGARGEGFWRGNGGADEDSMCLQSEGFVCGGQRWSMKGQSRR